MFLQLFKGTLKSKLKSDTKRFEYLPAPSQSIEDGLFIYLLPVPHGLGESQFPDQGSNLGWQ